VRPACQSRVCCEERAPVLPRGQGPGRREVHKSRLPGTSRQQGCSARGRCSSWQGAQGARTLPCILGSVLRSRADEHGLSRFQGASGKAKQPTCSVQLQPVGRHGPVLVWSETNARAVPGCFHGVSPLDPALRPRAVVGFRGGFSKAGEQLPRISPAPDRRTCRSSQLRGAALGDVPSSEGSRPADRAVSSLQSRGLGLALRARCWPRQTQGIILDATQKRALRRQAWPEAAATLEFKDPPRSLSECAVLHARICR